MKHCFPGPIAQLDFQLRVAGLPHGVKFRADFSEFVASSGETATDGGP